MVGIVNTDYHRYCKSWNVYASINFKWITQGKTSKRLNSLIDVA